jgi:hypothetical protein
VSLPTLEELERLLTVYRYYNSDKLSDVTIRYGAKREHTFYGHKIHLTTQSKYFEDLFNNTSKVSDHRDREYREAEMTDRAQNTEEIILEGDEPTMVKLMLKFAYGRELHYPTTAVSLENVLFAIYMFRIAAKYEFPEHEQMAVTGFVVWLKRLCAGASVEGEGPTLHELSNVVDTVYAIPANGRLREGLIYVVTTNPKTCKYRTYDTLSVCVKVAAQGEPEFEEDLRAELLKSRPKEHKALNKAVLKTKCSKCRVASVKPSGKGDGGFCLTCGTFVSGGYRAPSK